MKPLARTQGLLVEQAGGETLVLDTDRDAAHCLDAAASSVWLACDGTRSERDIAAMTDLSLDDVRTTVAALSARGLLDDAGSSRREMLRKVTVGAAAVAVAGPVIRSIVVPSAAEAASCLPTGAGCATGIQCCSTICNAGACV
jgi:hypothetical protein